MSHKLNKEAFEVKKTAKKELKKPYKPSNSVPGLRARVTLLEQMLGINAVEE
jgi:hypothetical protein